MSVSSGILKKLLTNASTAMWGSSIPEGVNVCLDLLQICSIKKRELLSCERT